jgi:hypothetical protein
MLQGFDLALSPFLHCLHDTHLEPPHDTLGGTPVDGVPVRDVARGRTGRRH